MCESLGFTGTFETAMARFASLDDDALRRVGRWRGREVPLQLLLYNVLREEQHALVRAQLAWQPTEVERTLGLAQQAFGDLRGLLVGRDDALLDRAPAPGEWSLRDLLRHVLAAELRYAAQVLYSAHRRDDEPLAIPPERLPCDRLSPPEPQYADTRTVGLARILQRFAAARAQSDGLLGGLSDAVLARPSIWGVEVDVRYRLHQIAAHIAEHVVQCEKVLSLLGERDGEARRAVRRISGTRGAHEAISDPATLRALDAEYAAVVAELP